MTWVGGECDPPTIEYVGNAGVGGCRAGAVDYTIGVRTARLIHRSDLSKGHHMPMGLRSANFMSLRIHFLRATCIAAIVSLSWGVAAGQGVEPPLFHLPADRASELPPELFGDLPVLSAPRLPARGRSRSRAAASSTATWRSMKMSLTLSPERRLARE